MKFVSRSDLGWYPSEAPVQDTASGVKYHYEGTTVSTALLDDHALCLAEWKRIRASHMANKAENYADIAYNFGACPHGYVLEGRGIGRRSGANGNQELNRAHYAIVLLVGDKGIKKPTDAQYNAALDARHLLMSHGAGPEQRGHRDGYATACPGDEVYAWIKAGSPRKGEPKPAPKPKPQAPPFPGRDKFTIGAKNDHALKLQTWLAKIDTLIPGSVGPAYQVGPSRKMTQKDIRKVAAFQKHYVKSLGPADGGTGPLTWRYAWEVAMGIRKW